jgi:homoserine O-acetyltransferase
MKRAVRPAPAEGDLAIQRVGDFPLESGEVLREVRQAYRLKGEIDPSAGNVVLLFHSLTGSPADFGGWDPIVGPGLPIDTRRFAVVAANLLGSCYGTRFRRDKPLVSPRPAIGTRDMARLAALLLDHLGVGSAALVAGGSLPGRAAAVLVFAAPAGPSAWGAGWNHIHRVAISGSRGAGLALARMVGMMTYRTPFELERRFRAGDIDAHPVREYLGHQGDKLVRRFSAKSYLTLLDSMDAHDVGRGRGGVARALGAFPGRLSGVGIPGDLLYPPDEVRRWTQEAQVPYHELLSPHGHDAFLLETKAVGRLFHEALDPDARHAAQRRRYRPSPNAVHE